MKLKRMILPFQRRRRQQQQQKEIKLPKQQHMLLFLLCLLSPFQHPFEKNQHHQQQQQQISKRLLFFAHGQSLSCDVENDTCPSANDGVCDSRLGANPKPGCEDGDCADCDLCNSQLSFDCQACLNAQGCVWCPSDGTCYNSAHYTSFGGSGGSNSENGMDNFHGVLSSCNAVAEFLSGETGGTCTRQENHFSDPLYSAQEWVYNMINIVPVWEQGIYGTNVRVRINDGGVDASHIEFADRFDLGGSCDTYLPQQQQQQDTGNFDGTGVAAILGAASNNSVCSVGIAPGVTISSCNIVDRIPTKDDGNGVVAAGAYDFLVEKLDTFDISQNSYGLFACENDTLIRRLDQRERRILQGDENCPFQVTTDTSQSSPSSNTHPCDICDFSNSTLSDECEAAIIFHCAVFYEDDVEACLDFLDLLLDNTICSYDKLPDSAVDALTTGITEGRNGRGIIYIFASGNSYNLGDDVNFGALTNSRFTITVGAVGKDGKHASYSTPGAALFVSAPGGDYEYVSNHVGAQAGGDTCGNIGAGTTFACPVVSGVVALLLEVNPNLSWRDVQGILAETSTMVFDDENDDTRITNAAGYNHSNFYGFGIVNAEKAVEAAKSWKRFRPETMRIAESGFVNIELDDSPGSVTSTVSVTLNDADEEFVTESVELLLDLQHFSRGDLEIVLTSPQGTSSILHPGNRPENTQLDDGERWRLMTVRNWGESPAGPWTLRIRDLRPGDVSQCVNQPFYTVVNDIELTCRYLSDENFCFNSSLNESPQKFGNEEFQPLLDVTSDGINLQQACCDCGGGMERTDFTDILKQWRLVVHGRVINGDTFSPTSGPSGNPSLMPSNSSSNVPTIQASASPTRGPTRAPVQAKSRNPTQPLTNEDDERSPRERRELVVNILATIIVFFLIAGCCYNALKPPPKKDYSRASADPTVSSAELI